jgi:predicted regulator of Ras-like GTPase activity (Roadblock/LC7/MglB family)
MWISIHRSFRNLIENIWLEGASLVYADSLPISYMLKPGMEEDRIAAISAAILSLGERVGEELAKEALEQITIKSRDGYVILTSVENDAVMVVANSYHFPFKSVKS